MIALIYLSSSDKIWKRQKLSNDKLYLQNQTFGFNKNEPALQRQLNVSENAKNIEFYINKECVSRKIMSDLDWINAKKKNNPRESVFFKYKKFHQIIGFIILRFIILKKLLLSFYKRGTESASQLFLDAALENHRCD